MIFASLEFIFLFYPVSILVYFLVPKKHLKWRNLALLAVSLMFYGWGEPIYVFLMIFSITFDYFYGYGVAKYKLLGDDRTARKFVAASMITNIFVLGFFKYADFIIENFNRVPALPDLPLLNLALPIGISFYTFQTMSYTIDIYRGDAKLQRNIVSFGAFVSFFPALIAGPIVRYQHMDNQLRERDESIAMFASGTRTFLAGLGKKIFLANVAGELWEMFRDVPVDERTVVGAWIGLVCFAFQIYFDFSGYSDMAIGLAKIFGFRLLENFNYPYISRSITDFWRRWHISLSMWFRDYLYFPLGGSRCSKLKNCRNLLVVWFITGLWHGASWNYVLWGLYYFALLMIERAFLLRLLEKAPKFAQHFYTLLFVLFGWLLFVFEDMGAGIVHLGNMFGVGAYAGFISPDNIYDITRNLLFFAVCVIAATPLPKSLFYRFYENYRVTKAAAYVGGIAVLLFAVAYLVSDAFNPFLYFRF